MFSKDIYLQNRKAGKRGQGEYPNPIVGIEATPPTSARGLGLRKTVSATKHSPFNPPAWSEHRAAVARKVAAREEVAKARSVERRAVKELEAVA